MIAEYRRIILVKEERLGTVHVWQSRWEKSNKGRWTYQLIPKIEIWYKRKHGLVDLYLTLALMGHGCFGSYLQRSGKSETVACWLCNHPNDDVSHTLFECDTWAEKRRRCDLAVDKALTHRTW